MASKSVNKVTLIGNLTRDPELKYTPQGTAVASFGLATNRTWATATGEVKEDVQFHKIVAWQKLAELCQKLLSKGRKIYLEGRIAYRTFVGSDGMQRTMTEIIMDDFVIFDDRRKMEEAAASAETKSEESDDFDMNMGIKTADEPKMETKKDEEKKEKEDEDEDDKDDDDEKDKDDDEKDEDDDEEEEDKDSDKKDEKKSKKDKSQEEKDKSEEIDPDDIPF